MRLTRVARLGNAFALTCYITIQVHALRFVMLPYQLQSAEPHLTAAPGGVTQPGVVLYIPCALCCYLTQVQHPLLVT